MKITKELKLLKQYNNFIRLVFSAIVFESHAHLYFAYAGFVINGVGLIYWCLVKEDEDNGPTEE